MNLLAFLFIFLIPSDNRKQIFPQEASLFPLGRPIVEAWSIFLGSLIWWEMLYVLKKTP